MLHDRVRPYALYCNNGAIIKRLATEEPADGTKLACSQNDHANGAESLRRSSTLLLEGAGPWQRRATYGRKRHLRRTPMTEAEAHQPGTTRMSAKARVTKGLLQGVTITGFGLGGAFSNLVAGFIAQRFGFPIGFLSLAATAAVAFALFLSRCRRPRARAATQNRRRRQHSSAARRVGAFQAKPSAGCRRSPVPLSFVSSRPCRDRPARRTATIYNTRESGSA